MAVQPRELEHPRPDELRPPLILVPPPPARPRALPAVTFVLLLIGLIGFPAARAWWDRPGPLAWEPRPAGAASITHLDSLAPFPGDRRPRSSEPVAGAAFVSCTRLWTAMPDGSRRRAVVERPGVSSPAFAPDARTIAYFIDTSAGQELWMVAADGSAGARVGELRSHGSAPEARAGALSWSPDGTRLAFALTSPRLDAWSGGSTIWVLYLKNGVLRRSGVGYPAPFWAGNALTYAAWDKEEAEPDFIVEGDGPRRFGWKLSQSGQDDLAAQVAPGPHTGVWDRAVATLRRGPYGANYVSVRRSYWDRDRHQVGPPEGTFIPDEASLALTQDGRQVLVELGDTRGDRDLGVLDRASETWRVFNYAWDPAASPAPMTSGPIRARRARGAVIELLDYYYTRSPRAATLMMGKRPDEDLLPFKWHTSVVNDAVKQERGWSVPVVVYGRTRSGSHAWRDLVVDVRKKRGGLHVSPRASSELQSILTVEDALGFVEHALGRELTAPAGLPQGAQLNLEDPVAVWKWGNEPGQGFIRFIMPGAGRHNGRFEIGYGDVYFYGGCGGGSGREDPVDVTGTPGLMDRISGSSQVIWPALPKAQRDAELSVYGQIPLDRVLSIARAMEATR